MLLSMVLVLAAMAPAAMGDLNPRAGGGGHDYSYMWSDDTLVDKVRECDRLNNYQYAGPGVDELRAKDEEAYHKCEESLKIIARSNAVGKAKKANMELLPWLIQTCTNTKEVFYDDSKLFKILVSKSQGIYAPLPADVQPKDQDKYRTKNPCVKPSAQASAKTSAAEPSEVDHQSDLFIAKFRKGLKQND